MGKTENTTRRGYVKLSAAGLLPTSLIRPSKDKTTIPLLKSGKEVVKTKQVPKEWWDQVQHVKETIEKARHQLEAIPGYYSSSIESDDVAIAGLRRKKITVEVDKKELPDISTDSNTDNGPFPEQIDGVSVDLAEKTEAREIACNNLGNFNPLPGGVGIFVDIGGSSLKKGSTCCKVTYNGKLRMLTAGHLSNCSSGNSVYTDRDASNKVGEISKAVSGTDWALISDSGSNFDDTVRFPSGSRYDVGGHVTEQSLQYYDSVGQTIHKLGRETGISTGRIQALNQSISTSCINHNRGVVIGNDAAIGDSGGPSFVLNPRGNNEAYIASLIQYNKEYPTGSGCSGELKRDKSGGLPAWYLFGQGIRFQ